jgi:ELWxxDGT repeat protein
LENRRIRHRSQVGDIYPGNGWSSPTAYYEFAGLVYMQANDGLTGAALCRMDGIGAVLVADLNPGSEGSYPPDFVSHGGTLYFAANNGLWRMSG